MNAMITDREELRLHLQECLEWEKKGDWEMLAIRLEQAREINDRLVQNMNEEE
jgi:hypothetical protein